MPMLRRLSSSAILLFLASSCSPANPEPVVVPTAPKPSAAPPPVVARTQATWSFPDSGGRADAQIDLGARGIFQVGERGRRWLIAQNGEVTQASVLIPQPLVDVQEHAGKLVIVGLDGTVYEVKEPLGPPVASHAPKKDAAEGEGPITHAAGKEAIFGLFHDGAFRRSGDFGVSWSDVKLPLRPGEEPVGLAANKRGEVMVLLHPQRVLFSADDGATFNALATPGIGAESIERDGHDDLYLRGYGQERFAKLLSGPWRLQAVKDAPEPLASHVGKQKPSSHEVVHRQLAGSRLVTMLETSDDKYTKKSVAVSVAPLGQMPAAPFEIEPALSRWSPVRVAGHEGTVVVAVYDQDADPPVTRIRRTTDEGKTWELVGSLEGREKGQFHLAVGPSWIAVGELCNPKTKDCTPPQVKVGNKAWAPLDIAAKLQPQSFLFDAAHDRLLLLASRESERVLLEGKLSGGPLGIVDVELPRGQVSAATLDTKGDVRLVYASPTRLVKVTAGKTPSVGKPLHLPFHTYEIDLAGDRGYAHWGDKAWETLDGGEHWAEVAPGPSGNVRCTAIGCVEGGAVRMGWDLNPGDPAPLESSLTEPKDKPKPTKPPKPTTPAKEISLACTASGPWKKMAGQVPRAGDTAFEGDVRFVSPIYGGFGDSDSMFVTKGSGAPQKITLLGPQPKMTESKTVRSWTHTSSAGIVAARYQFQLGKTASGGYNPVDVELGWYSTARGKSGKVKLPKVPAFRVGRSSPSALAEVVNNNILFLPNNGDAQLHFITDAGKITLIPRPKTPDVYGVFDHAIKIGERIVLASTMNGIHATLAATDDMGKNWTVSTWTLGQSSALTSLGGKPTLFLREGWGVVEPHALLSFDSVTPDPPALVPIDTKKLDAATASLTACNAKSTGFLAEIMTGDETPYLTVKIDGKTEADKRELGSEARVLRIGEGGAACVQSIVAGGGEASAVIAPSDMTHAWLVRPKDEGSEYRPLSCKAP
jgi:photosystem II stability/assembly factor-like uncharacterized protein